MKHLIISREYPPAPYAPGGIGTYVANIARLLAERGETVRIIGQRWDGAPQAREVSSDGRLIVHRIGDCDLPPNNSRCDEELLAHELEGLKNSVFPNQWFAWHAALLAERLIEEGEVDVVEGQDWEAPLYFLLLRRALGLGPQRHPPCIVHLHSPTEIIHHFNGHPSTARDYSVMKRMESYCIHAADALLCPSNYLAHQCGKRYGLAPERIKVVPLPVGFTEILRRDRRVWEQGSICFVGRLEPRKGIIEWFEAAARVAHEDQAVHFDFVGADVWKMRRTLLQRLPQPLQARFRFHGSRPHAELPAFLARARAAVVPSRWENFPNVCIEAMSSGLPVIATRFGGMVELIEDGRTGWLAPESGVAGMVDGLAEALRRCLAASAEQRAAMGHAAAEAVRRICDNEQTVGEHLAFRAEVERHGASRSLGLGIPAGEPPHAEPSGEAAARTSDNRGAGIVIRVDRLADAAPVLESIRAQTKVPCCLAVVCTSPPADEDSDLRRQLENAGGLVLVRSASLGPEAWNAGLAALQRDAAAFWLFLDRHDRLGPGCLELIGAVLSRRPEVGIASFWTHRADGSGQIEVNPCPKLPYQLIENDVVPASAFRTEAIDRGPPFRAGMPPGYDTWDIANKVLAKGWAAVTYPGILASRATGGPSIPWPEATALRAIRAEVLERFSGGLDPDLLEVIDLHVPMPMLPSGQGPLAEGRFNRPVLRSIVRGLRHPSIAYRAAIRRSRALFARRRLPFRRRRPVL